MTLQQLIFIGGILHFGILIASLMVPQVLDWKSSLARLDKLPKQLIWIHGAFIVLVIVGFGLLSVALAAPLADGSPLARAVCLFIGVFWATRLALQLFVVDARAYLTTPLRRIGYHGLTVVFAYHSIIYVAAALRHAGSPFAAG